MQETWGTRVWSLNQKDHLEEVMATHSCLVAWRIPWTEEAGGLQSTGRREADLTEWAGGNQGRGGNWTAQVASCGAKRHWECQAAEKASSTARVRSVRRSLLVCLDCTTPEVSCGLMRTLETRAPVRVQPGGERDRRAAAMPSGCRWLCHREGAACLPSFFSFPLAGHSALTEACGLEAAPPGREPSASYF